MAFVAVAESDGFTPDKHSAINAHKDVRHFFGITVALMLLIAELSAQFTELFDRTSTKEE